MSTPDDIAELIAEARKCASAIYIAVDAVVADDVSRIILGVVDAVADLTTQLAEAQAVALEQAANRMPLYLRGTYGGDVDSSKAFEWLHARADAIRAEGAKE